MTATVLVDVDGTLVDSNYLHTIAWARAFAECSVPVDHWRVHRHIGMGGDQLVESVAGEGVERDHGERIRSLQGERFEALIGEVRAFEGAREFLETVRERETSVVLASSAPEDEIGHYVDLLDARDLIDGYTTADDVDDTKPAPDVLEAAIELSTGDGPVLLGDTTWDVEAAERLGIPAYAVLTGGFAATELREAGAVEVYDSVGDLVSRPLELVGPSS